MRHLKSKNAWRLSGLACLGLALGAAAWSAPSAKADISATAPSLDDLLNLPQPGNGSAGKGAAGKDTGKDTGNDAGKKGVTTDPEVARRMSGQQAAEAFQKAIQDMFDVSERLAKQQDAGENTQRMQTDILTKLEQVIAAAKQQQQKGSGKPDDKDDQESREADSGSKDNSSQDGDSEPGEPGEPGKPGKPSSKSGKGKPSKSASKGGATAGTGANGGGNTAADSTLIKDNRETWGKLPPRLRDQLLEGLSENVSPVYKEMTESYYRRLAEESGK